MDLKEKIDKNKLPTHVAIIMDGNGRWAKIRGKHRVFGHKNGVTSVREVVEAAAEIGTQYLTLYAFSTENWNRPREEINALMLLLVSSLDEETKTLLKNNISLHVIGDIQSLPDKVSSHLKATMKKTASNTGMKLILALSYSSRWEIVEAARLLAKDIFSGKIDPEKVNQDLFAGYLNTSDVPDPDMLIRTGGEFRISNFLLWQIAYSELYFTETLWPDFRKKDFFEAIMNYQNRERRFGKTSEQLH